MRTAVVDVGSNSIKLLVADLGPEGRPAEVLSRTLEVRISKGISSDTPRLSPEAIERGGSAVASLAAQARELGARRIAAVATSAVRDASNGTEFRDQVRAASGLELRILTGPEEANLIGRGLLTDPALASLRDFDVFDLGGGSMECLEFRDRTAERAFSLPLGCVRLTETFASSATGPISEEDMQGVSRRVTQALSKSGFPFPVPDGAFAVGTGGTLTTVRAIAAARRGVPLERTDPLVRVSFLREILAAVGPMGIAARREVKGLSPQRADVFPTALVTLIALAELGRVQAFHHSLRNLRWGVAAEILSQAAIGGA